LIKLWFRIAEKRREAQQAVNLMQATYARISQNEKNGLLIVVAIYGSADQIEGYNSTAGSTSSASSSGNTSPISMPSSPDRDVPQDCIDVTVPLQCMVQDSKLILVGGSKVCSNSSHFVLNPIDV
jgi:hypothetical protein